ncbi:MAG: hypothetical protein LBR74_07600 [Eubacterium sp.]|nr:hypothetical protein [Eubacterium sp.]
MTRKQAEQLFGINHEIWLERRRVQEFLAAKSDPSVSITGLPHLNSRVYSGKVEIEILQKAVEKRIERLVKRYLEIMDFIEQEPDSWARQLLTLRCLYGLPWERVAQSMGGNNTPGGVKRAYYRYFEKKREN